MTEAAELVVPRRQYPPESRLKAYDLHAQGLTSGQIGLRLGIPQQTISYWLNRAKLSPTSVRTTANEIQAKVAKSVAFITHKVESEVEQLVRDSLSFGRSVLGKANDQLNDADAGQLVSLANAGKTGITIARQALGLDQDQSTKQQINIGQMSVYARAGTDPLSTLRSITGEIVVPTQSELSSTVTVQPTIDTTSTDTV